jgi:hypothetical protein
MGFEMQFANLGKSGIIRIDWQIRVKAIGLPMQWLKSLIPTLKRFSRPKGIVDKSK